MRITVTIMTIIITNQNKENKMKNNNQRKNKYTRHNNNNSNNSNRCKYSSSLDACGAAVPYTRRTARWDITSHSPGNYK